MVTTLRKCVKKLLLKKDNNMLKKYILITIITLFVQYIGSLDISVVVVSIEQTYSQPGNTGSFLRETVSQPYRYSPHRLSLLDRIQSETVQNHFYLCILGNI